jgi:hypothetical protein
MARALWPYLEMEKILINSVTMIIFAGNTLMNKLAALRQKGR